MKYTKEQRLNIGRMIYEGELTRYQAAAKYDICDDTARDYMRLYRAANGLPPKKQSHGLAIFLDAAKPDPNGAEALTAMPEPHGLDELEAMTKEQLIKEIVKARINEERLKKGYEVKGDGSVIRYVSKNIK